MSREARWLQGTELLIETPSLFCLKVFTHHTDKHLGQRTLYFHYDFQERPNFDQERLKQTKQPNDSTEYIAMLIKRAMAAEMESFQETVALMLSESLEKAMDPIQKHMAENGNILRSLKEQAEIHAKKFSTVFNQMDNIQVSLRKTEKETSSCVAEVTKLQKKV